MKTISVKATLIHAILGLLTAFLPAWGSAQDYIGMAIQYGNNVQSILHTEIMNDAGRKTMQQAIGKKSSTPGPKAKWPSHIHAGIIATHVFTVSELAAMYNNDAVKTRSLLSGKTITIEGKVKLPDRDGLQSFRLTSPEGSGYYVWVYYAKSGFGPMQHGSTIRVQGVAAVERRSFLSLRSPRLSNVSSTPGATPPKKQTTVSTNTGRRSADYSMLKFSSQPSVTRKANQLIVDKVAPALKQGVSKADVLKILNSGELQKEFVKTSKDHGFATDDLADVLTVAMVLGWQVANDQPEINEKAGYQQIRQQLREELSRAAWLSTMNNEQKQMIAELTGTGMMVIVSRYLHGRQQKEPSTIRQASTDARQFIEQFTGMNLQQYKLTSSGFVKS